MTTSPKMILRLALASSRVFFRPDPHFLIAATARQVSDWALLNNENTETLRHAMQKGVYSLLDLCVDKAQLTMNDIRRLHLSRFSLVNPISDLIDRCAGPQWSATPNFWQGGVSNPVTISIQPTRTLFQIIIYGELFASSMRAFLEPELDLPWFDHDFRMDYIKYCIPDAYCQSYDDMTVLPIGPYAAPYATPDEDPQEDSKSEHDLVVTSRESEWNTNQQSNLMPEGEDDQVGLGYLLGCSTWTRAWEGVRRAIGPDFEDEWRQEMWHSAVQLQGFEGLEMLRPGGADKWRPRLEAMREAIARLETKDKPKIFNYGINGDVSESPNLALEVHVTVATYPGSE
ncbi:MAG: hypothetical protein Q9219_004399 [cf. Caloplaca sp. 3 TL-2023]